MPTPPTLTFDETMHGPFALGETDPQDGETVGEQNDTALALHATVSIPDVDRFVKDPDHEGNLNGSIDFGPFGGNVEAEEGVFNLFKPAEEEGRKLMVYELPVTYDGTSYYLAGKKKVQDDSGLDVWSDTTTLYTRLHEGPDASGPVVGAGILRLGVDDLIDLVSTMQVEHTDSADAKAQAFTTFGRFFLGELWDTYAPHLPLDVGTAQ